MHIVHTYLKHTCTSCQCVSLSTPWVRCGVAWRSRSFEQWWPRYGTWPWLGSPRWGWWRSVCRGPHCPSSGCDPYRQWTPAWLSFSRGSRARDAEESYRWDREEQEKKSLARGTRSLREPDFDSSAQSALRFSLSFDALLFSSQMDFSLQLLSHKRSISMCITLFCEAK